MSKQTERTAVLHDVKINDCFCVTFREVIGDTETSSFKTYLTKHEALMDMSHFEYHDIWEKLAKV